jgi:hypothetical protein
MIISNNLPLIMTWRPLSPCRQATLPLQACSPHCDERCRLAMLRRNFLLWTTHVPGRTSASAQDRHMVRTPLLWVWAPHAGLRTNAIFSGRHPPTTHKCLHAQTDKRSRRQATHARSSPPATHAAAAAAMTFFFGDIRPSSIDVRQDQHMIRCRHTGSHAQADTRPGDERPPSPATYAVGHSTPGRTNT